MNDSERTYFMNVVELTLPTINKFSSAYLSQKESILPFFTYNPFSVDTYSQRNELLKNRSFRRRELVAHLQEFNQRYHADAQTLHSIEKLNDRQSVVVISGQQAGLMTGPIYTISKIISTIKLAQEQELKLGIPVVPIFWIAGEDHDFQEINHVNLPKDNEIQKHVFQMKEAGKKMVSELQYDKEKLRAWLLEIINSYGESPYTKELTLELEHAMEVSTTFVDMFASLITKLFKGTGLVLVNAADPSLRKLETPYLQQILMEHGQIRNGMLHSQKELEEQGFKPMLEIDSESMNIFFHENGERELLCWDEAKQIAYIKGSGRQFTLEQLNKLIEEQPENFSNNVVTRPLMQEFLFPTLAFIGGPGEISYWAELGRCFRSVDLEMPPVVPRISLTLLERHIDRTLVELDEDISDVVENGLEEKRKAWLYKQELESLEETLMKYHEQYAKVHDQFREVGNSTLPHHRKTFEKNWDLIDKQFTYIHRLIERSAYEKHENMMSKYERAELAVLPKGMPQERVWNIYYFLNKYGLDFVQRLCELPLEHNGKHKIIKL
ncbi:bacillithiol biosynthesis cysteine-adding enzyme BshC [Sutcliffiella horikoshii]|uniref:bacillithiol biosynthesis cysteine-adding enzyme BshC n=1 Tax=Sutcliffiella horikoshii TaxID=79883 RepID=UPI001CFDE996|nr:bacillithiol biosynthesis cysteine-adding enzyme BshC [Sutcliffiella horikoshii]